MSESVITAADMATLQTIAEADRDDLDYSDLYEPGGLVSQP